MARSQRLDAYEVAVRMPGPRGGDPEARLLQGDPEARLLPGPRETQAAARVKGWRPPGQAVASRGQGLGVETTRPGCMAPGTFKFRIP